MDIKETFNQLDNTKFSDFNNRLEGFEKLFKDNDLLDMRDDLTKLNKDEVIALCAEMRGYRAGFLDTLRLIAPEINLGDSKKVFLELWEEHNFNHRIDDLLAHYPYTNIEERIDFRLFEEYGTSSREEVAKMMIDDLDTSSDGEAKKLFLQEFLSLHKRENNIE